MNYRELQAKAKKLGLKYVGVSKKDLQESIESTTKEKRTPTNEEKDNNDKDAVVYNGKHKVRTFTIERHGPNYIELAKKYISHKDREEYTLRMESFEAKIACPYCGRKFRK